MAAVAEEALGIARGDRLDERRQRGVERLACLDAEVAPERIQLAPGELDGADVRRVRRQEDEPAGRPLDGRAHRRRLARGEVVHHDYLPGRERLPQRPGRERDGRRRVRRVRRAGERHARREALAREPAEYR